MTILKGGTVRFRYPMVKHMHTHVVLGIPNAGLTSYFDNWTVAEVYDNDTALIEQNGYVQVAETSDLESVERGT